MEILDYYLRLVTAAFSSGPNRLYWIYLVTALLAAGISYRLYSGKPFSFSSFRRYVFPREAYFSPSARMDYFLFLMRPIWLFMLLAPLLLTMGVVGEGVIELLEAGFGARPASPPGIWGISLYSFLLFIAFDFGEYLAHNLLHRVWFLWEFHKVHHSAQVLNPVTAYRFHPLDDIFTMGTVTITTGICHGLFYWYWGAQPVAFHVIGAEVGVFLFYMAAYNLRHTHVWLPYPQKVSHIFISPAQHQIHHSTARRHWDKNMGFVFAFWDWMFGTLYVPKEKEELQFGIGNGEDEHFHSPSKVYILPFLNIIRRSQSKKMPKKKIEE